MSKEPELRFNKDGELDTRGRRQLKPCPFCGGEASIGTVKYSPCDITKLNNREKGYFVNCQICSARNEVGISYATEEEAIKHWNTRNSHDALLAACEEGEQRLAFLQRKIVESSLIIVDGIEIRKTASCIKFIKEAIAAAEEK